MTIPLFHVDAFTDRSFSGNPAAVCLLPESKPDAWMQQVAAEMNLSETAFILREDAGIRLRWFTPKVEVDLCGHATLASAHVLWQEGWAQPNEPITFNTRSGVLKAAHSWSKLKEPVRFNTPSGVVKADRVCIGIELDFPLTPEEPVAEPPGLVAALGVPMKYVGKSKFDFLVEVESEAVLRSLSPNFHLLASLPIRGVIVTSVSARHGFDFVSRFFAPATGIDEDPVTGSAHCCLAAYWRKRLKKSEFVAYQASARGGIVRVRIEGERAILGGKAVTVAKGELLT